MGGDFVCFFCCYCSVLHDIISTRSCGLCDVIFFVVFIVIFFFQAEDGIRDLVRSRGLGDVYKRQINTPLGAGITAASTLEDETHSFLATYQQRPLTRAELDEYLERSIHSSRLVLSNLQQAANPVSYTHLTLPTNYSV